MLMNDTKSGRKAAKEVGLTERQIGYLVKNGIIKSSSSGKMGSSYRFTPEEMELLKLVSELRKDFKPAQIKVIIDGIRKTKSS